MEGDGARRTRWRTASSPSGRPRRTCRSSSATASGRSTRPCRSGRRCAWSTRRTATTASDVRERPDGLRLGVRVALPPARTRRERHDAADGVPRLADPAERGFKRRPAPAESDLLWTDNWTNPAATDNLIERATDAAFTQNIAAGSEHRRRGDGIQRHFRDQRGDVLLPRSRRERPASYSVWTGTASATP